MKQLIILLMALCLSMSVIAQDFVSDFLGKYKDTDAFTQVNISSKMFQLIANTTDADTEGVIKNLTGMKILSSDKETGRYYQEARTLIGKKIPEYEELMSIQEDNEKVWMYIREQKGVINELVILVGGSGEFVLMSFTGKIDLKQISKLTKAVNVEGIDYLNKVKKNK